MDYSTPGFPVPYHHLPEFAQVDEFNHPEISLFYQVPS